MNKLKVNGIDSFEKKETPKMYDTDVDFFRGETSC
jgi:hypothetical protein